MQITHSVWGQSRGHFVVSQGEGYKPLEGGDVYNSMQDEDERRIRDP